MRFVSPLRQGLLCCALLVGCGKPTPLPPPLPTPIVVKKSFLQNLLSDNKMSVELRNDGASGLVVIEVSSHRKVGTEEIRGESGLGKSVRETFFTDPAPPTRTRPVYKEIDSWKVETKMAAGESKTVVIPLPRYDVAKMLAGDELRVFATGLPASDAESSSKNTP